MIFVIFNAHSTEGKEVKSSPTKVTCGMPQGSAFSPALFTLYSAPLKFLIGTSKILKYCHTPEDSIEILQKSFKYTFSLITTNNK